MKYSMQLPLGDILIGRYGAEPQYTKLFGGGHVKVYSRVDQTKKVCIAVFDNEFEADEYIRGKTDELAMDKAR